MGDLRLPLEHDSEKWVPVFRKDHAQTKMPERDDDSKKSHPALARPGELRRAGVGAGFADHAIAPRRFGEIKPSVGALEQPLIVRGIFGAGGKPDAHRDERHVGSMWLATSRPMRSPSASAAARVNSSAITTNSSPPKPAGVDRRQILLPALSARGQTVLAHARQMDRLAEGRFTVGALAVS